MTSTLEAATSMRCWRYVRGSELWVKFFERIPNSGPRRYRQCDPRLRHTSTSAAAALGDLLPRARFRFSSHSVAAAEFPNRASAFASSIRSRSFLASARGSNLASAAFGMYQARTRPHRPHTHGNKESLVYWHFTNDSRFEILRGKIPLSPTEAENPPTLAEVSNNRPV
jgi:hypothetical protein